MRPVIVQTIEDALGMRVYVPDYWFWYTAFIILGVLGSAWMAKRRGLPEAKFYAATLLTLLSAYLGGRLYGLFIVGGGTLTTASLIQLFKPGGTGSSGAYLGFMLGGMLWLRAFGIDRRKAFDIYAPFAAFTPVLGRLGCFMRGCCYGKLCNQSWCISYPRGSPAYHDHVQAGLITLDDLYALPVHPTQGYEALLGIVLLALLIYVGKKKRGIGLLFPLYLIGYAGVRFSLEFFRGDGVEIMLFFTIRQAFLILFFLIGLTFLFILKRGERPDVGRSDDDF